MNAYSCRLFPSIVIFFLMSSCNNSPQPARATLAGPAARKPVRLVTLDPGHFHAALVQKTMYDDVDSNVYVYAPAGPDVKDHLARISAYNTREKDPTRWNEHVYTGPDYLQQMIHDKKGNTVVLAGNNREKTSYILQSLGEGFNVLADKPMVIDGKAFGALTRAFDTAAARHLILYDIMTERYEITSILQRELASMPAVYGVQEKGDPAHPGVIASSVHRWYKYVSGKALIRPAWSFDVTQQGEGIVDVMTHVVDLVQWGCFPDQALDYKTDVVVNHARHWTTDLSLSQFRTVTGMTDFPGYLKKYRSPLSDTVLRIYANGQIDYHLKGICVRTTVTWTYDAPAGAGDTYSSVMRGTKANLVIRQDAAEHYQPTLYIEPMDAGPGYEQILDAQFAILQAKYPGISLSKQGSRWVVIIPGHYTEGHEAHFARVTEKFLGFLKDHNMPSWEVPNMLAKYYTTTRALDLARQGH
ncbi:MAG TPA: putative oxidoreductase C-terminal domain-containing protein [Puia sp.]|nr:putative oxidoreductase C-terminal domain-containing protein [Puia sp.]